MRNVNITATTSDAAIESYTREELVAYYGAKKSEAKAPLVAQAKMQRDLLAERESEAQAAAKVARLATIEAENADPFKQAIKVRMAEATAKSIEQLDTKLARWQAEMAKSVQDMAYTVKRYGVDIANVAATRQALQTFHDFVETQMREPTLTFDRMREVLKKEESLVVDRVLNGSGWDDAERHANVAMAKYVREFNANVDHAVKNQDAGRFFMMSL